MREWIPEALDAGLEYAAMVHKDSVIAEMDMERFAETVSDFPHTMYVAPGVETAREWLADPYQPKPAEMG
ncbi:hypothetical protein BRC81_02000 [Halobacteriales archaeon QS_1_68_20]|nr:MAG: hypothetical protein BRC81_02000 [Halobacteriales archaeon QS_1_68_20]